MIAFVPISHTLKHVITDEPRYNQFVAQRRVTNEVTAEELVLVSPDRLLFPFMDRVEAQFQPGAEPGTAAYVIFSPNYFGKAETTEIIAEFSCVVATRNGEGIVWGILFDYVQDVDRDSGRATFKIATGMGPMLVNFQIDEFLDEFHNGFYARGTVLQINAPTPGGGTLRTFPAVSNAACTPQTDG